MANSVDPDQSAVGFGMANSVDPDQFTPIVVYLVRSDIYVSIYRTFCCRSAWSAW